MTKRKPKPRKARKQPRPVKRLESPVPDDAWAELEAGLNRAVANIRTIAQPMPINRWP